MFSRIRQAWRMFRPDKRRYWVVFTANQTFIVVGEPEPPRFEGETARIRCIGKPPKPPTPRPKQAVATQAASRSVGEKAGEVALSGPEGNSRA